MAACRLLHSASWLPSCSHLQTVRVPSPRALGHGNAARSRNLARNEQLLAWRTHPDPGNLYAARRHCSALVTRAGCGAGTEGGPLMTAHAGAHNGSPDPAGLLLAVSSLLEEVRLFLELAQLFDRRGWSFWAAETLQRACGRLVYAGALLDLADQSHGSCATSDPVQGRRIVGIRRTYLGAGGDCSVPEAAVARRRASSNRSGPRISASARSTLGSASHSQATRSQKPSSTAER
jgi:hypothetical protein